MNNAPAGKRKCAIFGPAVAFASLTLPRGFEPRPQPSEGRILSKLYDESSDKKKNREVYIVASFSADDGLHAETVF